VRQHLGGPRGDLAIVHRRLISLALACVANDAFHLWLTTSFESTTIIIPETLQHVPSGVRDILLLFTDNLVERPHPQSAGTTKGTRKRPQKKEQNQRL